MKKFTFMLIAALMAVASFAGVPERKAALNSPREVTFVRHNQSGKKAMTVSQPLAQNTASKMFKAPKKAPRKAVSIDALEGEYILASINYDVNDAGELEEAAPAYSGTPVTIKKEGDNSIAITGFTSDATEDIIAKVNLDEGTISIADGQALLEDDTYGPIVLSNAEEEGAPITGTINEDGSIELDQLWFAMIAEGEYAGYMWSYYQYSSFVPVNGSMTWGEENAKVYIYQDPEDPKTATVFNFGNWEVAIDVSMKEDKTFVIESQLVYDGGDTYGQFYTYGLTDDATDFLTLTGTGTETKLDFDCMWTAYSNKGRWFGAQDPATITLTDGSNFVYPSIPDVAAMPADPKVMAVSEYDETKGYGYVVVDVPLTDVDGNDIKESKLFYQLFSDVAGDIQPIVYSAELYKNLDEDLTIIPYTLNDSYDFNVTEGYKRVYLNFDYTSYDRIGVKSIYTGGDETNETEIQWFEFEKPNPAGEFTFNFNAMDVTTSNNFSDAGDITEATTITSGSVSLTISPKTTSDTANRYWSTTSGPQLRVYSGTLTFEVPNGYVITGIKFNAAKWAEGNAADSGEFEGTTWSGEAQKVVVTIAANTQINSIVVTVAEGEGGGEEEDVLVELPEGVEPEAWTIEGTFNTTEDSDNVQEATQVAIDGTDIYIQGLAYYFPEAWLKGTIADGVATFPCGQFVGEDEYGKEYMVGTDDVETVCDIEFIYDAEAQTLTQKTAYILENGDSKTEFSFYGYWTDVFYYAGEPVVIDPVTPPADLVTESYSFKGMALVNGEEDDDDEEEVVVVTATEDDDDEEPSVPEFEPYSNQVLVGFDGDDLYIQGISEDLPEGWVKATKNEEGKYVIPANQYMGTLSIFTWKFDYYFTALDDDDNLTDVVLTYDPEHKTITTDQTLALNGDKNTLYFYLLYQDVVITKLEEFAATPADPSVVELEVGEDVEYPYVSFNIPNQSVDGEELINANLFYQVFIVKDGEVQPLTFDAESYEKFEADMTQIPYNYDDSWDIYKGGECVYLNQGAEEIASWTNIGVQSIYIAGGETHESNIVWLNADDPIVGISGVNTTEQARYFDLQGRRVANASQKGLIIKQTRQQDGTMKAVKVLRK